MITSYIYFFFEKGTSCVKVGKSNDPRGRAESLKENIDYDKSYCLKGTEDQILKIEKALHKTFQQTEYWISDRPKTSGHTEWYQLAGLDKIQHYLKEFFNLSEYIPIPPPLTAEQKALNETLVKKVKESAKRNSKYLDGMRMLTRFIQDCREIGSIKLRCIDSEYCMITLEGAESITHLPDEIRDLSYVGELHGYWFQYAIVLQSFILEKVLYIEIRNIKEVVALEHRLEKYNWSIFEEELSYIFPEENQFQY